MPLPCPVCAHERRSEIEAAATLGTSYVRLTADYGLPVGAMQRHGGEHMGLRRAGQCTLCERPDLAVNEALRDGASFRSVEVRWGLGHKLVVRHAREHLRLDRPRRTWTSDSCGVCDHEQRSVLDELIRTGALYIDIEARYQIKNMIISRHARKHLGIHIGRAGRRECAACVHPERSRIDEALEAGAGSRVVSEVFGLTMACAHAHATRHLALIVGRVGCFVCTHPLRDEIDAAIFTDEPYSWTARRFGLEAHNIYSHARNHLQYARDRRGRECLVCLHPDVSLIEEAVAAGVKPVLVARAFGYRHRQALDNHLSPEHQEATYEHQVRRLEAVSRWSTTA